MRSARRPAHPAANAATEGAVPEHTAAVRGPTIERFMTHDPHTVESDASVAEAHRRMREHRVRHLPVMEHGAVVGVVSQRDLYLMEALHAADPERVTVLEAMTPQPYTVRPDASVAEVADTMATQRLAATLVVEGGRLLGIFTAGDALAALIHVLQGDGARRSAV